MALLGNKFILNLYPYYPPVGSRRLGRRHI